jgi:cbb3-type cytochrome oxidase subunit 3
VAFRYRPRKKKTTARNNTIFKENPCEEEKRKEREWRRINEKRRE